MQPLKRLTIESHNEYNERYKRYKQSKQKVIQGMVNTFHFIPIFR